MRGGKLRHQITIQRIVQVGVNADNAPNFVSQTWIQVFAEVYTMRGREMFDERSQQRYSQEFYRFCVRYSEVYGLDASMKVIYDGSTYDIRAIMPDEQRVTECVIECTLQASTLGNTDALMGYIEIIPEGQVGVPYSATVLARGGTPPYKYRLKAGSTLPAGLSLGLTTGIISGTPTVTATQSVVVKVTDDDRRVHEMPAMTMIVTA